MVLETDWIHTLIFIKAHVSDILEVNVTYQIKAGAVAAGEETNTKLQQHVQFGLIALNV